MGKICDTAIFRLKVKTYWKVVSGELGGVLEPEKSMKLKQFRNFAKKKNCNLEFFVICDL